MRWETTPHLANPLLGYSELTRGGRRGHIEGETVKALLDALVGAHFGKRGVDEGGGWGRVFGGRDGGVIGRKGVKGGLGRWQRWSGVARGEGREGGGGEVVEDEGKVERS